MNNDVENRIIKLSNELEKNESQKELLELYSKSEKNKELVVKALVHNLRNSDERADKSYELLATLDAEYICPHLCGTLLDKENKNRIERALELLSKKIPSLATFVSPNSSFDERKVAQQELLESNISISCLANSLVAVLPIDNLNMQGKLFFLYL